VDVKAFTGKAKFCKKFAAGFSNCCKDSGWGQDVGLARCSSEEKALAKENQQADGQYWGVLLEEGTGDLPGEKRSYCQFDSKLAQIVQEQGRNGQLHISFGAPAARTAGDHDG
jgi:conjugal transfer mating pair stabilization protein TraN